MTTAGPETLRRPEVEADPVAEGISIQGLRKVFRDSSGNQVAAIDGIDLEIGSGEFWVLLGASGCGKTTLLRCLAGLETPDEGMISIAGRGVKLGVGSVGMVFQSYALWPHMTVFQNVAYPLTTGPRRSRLSRSEVKARVSELLDLMGLGKLAQRKINQLSGGQQQRVALARAIAPGAKIVLFDEPLSNIDAKVREQLRRDIKEMQRRLGFTAVYVTHDQAEAFELADQIAVMDSGKVVQVGNGADLYEQPRSRFVAEFVGSANVTPGVLVTVKPVQVSCAYGELRGTPVGDDFMAGGEVQVFSRPHHWWIAADPASDENAWRGIYAGRAHLGAYDEHLVELGGVTVRIWTGNRALQSSFDPGQDVWVGVSPDDCRLLS